MKFLKIDYDTAIKIDAIHQIFIKRDGVKDEASLIIIYEGYTRNYTDKTKQIITYRIGTISEVRKTFNELLSKMNEYEKG